MVRPPNQENGNFLRELSNKHSLTDPFRARFPNKIAFSYSPFGVQRKNRSRLDFFLVSTGTMESMEDVGIFSAQLSSMFDHKPIYITFGDGENIPKAQRNSKKCVTNWYLDDKIVNMSVTLAALQVISRTINVDMHRAKADQVGNSIKFLTAKLITCLKLREKISLNIGNENEHEEMLLAALYSEFDENLDRLPSWEHLFNLTTIFSKKEVFTAFNGPYH
jgi:hypothetical protein